MLDPTQSKGYKCLCKQGFSGEKCQVSQGNISSGPRIWKKAEVELILVTGVLKDSSPQILLQNLFFHCVGFLFEFK